MKLEQIAQRHGGEEDEQSGSQNGSEEPGLTVLTGHLNRIAALEKEVKRLKQVCPVVLWYSDQQCCGQHLYNKTPSSLAGGWG